MVRKPFPLLSVAWQSPSEVEHGMDPIYESFLRYRGTMVIDDLIRRLGDPNMLQHSSGVRCTAHYYFQAFYLYKSLQTEDSGVVGLAAVFLACKVTEYPRKMRDICRVYQAAIQENYPNLELNERELFHLRECVARIEGFLLRVVDFILRPPADDFLGPLDALKHSVLLALRAVVQEGLAQEICNELCLKARAFMYDSFAGLLPHKFEPSMVAVGCIFIAFCFLQPNLAGYHPALKQPWSALFPRLPMEDDLVEVKKEFIKLFRARKHQSHPVVALELPDQTTRQPVQWHGSQKRMSSPAQSPGAKSSINSVRYESQNHPTPASGATRARHMPSKYRKSSGSSAQSPQHQECISPIECISIESADSKVAEKVPVIERCSSWRSTCDLRSQLANDSRSQLASDSRSQPANDSRWELANDSRPTASSAPCIESRTHGRIPTNDSMHAANTRPHQWAVGHARQPTDARQPNPNLTLTFP